MQEDEKGLEMNNCAAPITKSSYEGDNKNYIMLKNNELEKLIETIEHNFKLITNDLKQCKFNIERILKKL